jgi:hypothetical protein
MLRFWLFLHLLGFTMWIGGSLAAMVSGIAARREGREMLAAVARAQAAAHKAIIAPGALLAVLSGLILTFSVTGRSGAMMNANTPLMVMQGAGLLGALLVLLIGLPTAARLGRLDPTGQGAGFFDELRQRQRIVGSVSGILALVALVAGALVRYPG